MNRRWLAAVLASIVLLPGTALAQTNPTQQRALQLCASNEERCSSKCKPVKKSVEGWKSDSLATTECYRKCSDDARKCRTNASKVGQPPAQ